MTFFGDTGLWFVPTAEVLADRTFSGSGQRANFDREQGFTDIQHYTGTFAVGLGDRAEIFGSFRFLTRIDRDLRPLFSADMARVGGVLNEYPLVNDQFSGNQVGDFLVGAKVNLLSESRQSPAAVALRGLVKLPTGDKDTGTTTGEVDGEVDIVVSKLVANGNVELAGFGGIAFRTDPDTVNLANGFRWGVGVGAPINAAFRVFGEVSGEALVDENVTVDQPLSGNRRESVGARDRASQPCRRNSRRPVEWPERVLRWGRPEYCGGPRHSILCRLGVDQWRQARLPITNRLSPGRQGLRPAAAATTATPTGEPAANCNGVM